MFYHIKTHITGISSWMYLNKTKDEILTEFVCPFINKETTIFEEGIFNMSSIGLLKIVTSDQPITETWPLNKEEYSEKDTGSDYLTKYNYEQALFKKLHDEGRNVTQDIFTEAIDLLRSKKYESVKERLEKEKNEKYVFFICPFENKEVDENYEYIIKPAIEKYGFTIQKANEITHTNEINSEILKAISKSSFLIADLTDEKPNCYYEVGYGHALSKQIIITAKQNTKRHFDISTRKWIYWNTFRDLKINFEPELSDLIKKI